MYPNESLIDFFHRFKDTVENYANIGEDAPSEAIQRIQFIEALDRVRFWRVSKTNSGRTTIFEQE
jgi:hypothetical protein